MFSVISCGIAHNYCLIWRGVFLGQSHKRKGRILLQKECALLSKSEITKNYPIVSQFIKETPNLKWENLDQLETKARLFFEDVDNIKDIILIAKNEWEQDKRRKPEEVNRSLHKKCQLCGHAPIMTVCYINNIKTKESLEVGSECVNHFHLIDEADLKEQLKNVRKFSRRQELQKSIPDLHSKIQTWNKFIDSLPKYTTQEWEKRYIELGQLIRSRYDKYLSQKKLNALEASRLINEINNLLSEAILLKDQMINYCESNNDNKLIPHRSVLKFLSNMNGKEYHGIPNFYNQAEKWLIESGYITRQVFPRLNDKNLMNIFEREVRLLFDVSSFKLLSISQGGYVFCFRNRFNGLKMIIDHYTLMKKYGQEILSNTISDKEDIPFFINNAHVNKDVASYREIISHVLNVIDRRLEIETFHMGFNELYIKNANATAIFLLPLENTVEKYKNYLLMNWYDLSEDDRYAEKKQFIRLGERLSYQEYLEKTRERDEAYATTKEFT